MDIYSTVTNQIIIFIFYPSYDIHRSKSLSKYLFIRSDIFFLFDSDEFSFLKLYSLFVIRVLSRYQYTGTLENYFEGHCFAHNAPNMFLLISFFRRELLAIVNYVPSKSVGDDNERSKRTKSTRCHLLLPPSRIFLSDGCQKKKKEKKRKRKTLERFKSR